MPIAAGLLYPFFGLLLSPIIASAAMSLSSVSVVAKRVAAQRRKTVRVKQNMWRRCGVEGGMIPRFAQIIALVVCCSVASTTAGAPMVKTIRVPNGGIQPQAAVDLKGTLHLVYYKGDAGGGDLFYAKRVQGAEQFSRPIPVNSQKGSAIAAGSIRGAQMALGKNGRVHVAWNGGKGAAKARVGGKEVTPMLYTRLNAEGTAFESERNLITRNAGLDGGGAVAADNDGNVYVFWHGSAPENTAKEAGRAVFVARSTDDGKTFAAETRATESETGACGCCGMKAIADARGAVYVLYRAATENTGRGQTLLSSPEPGAPFKVTFDDPWKATTCPMSNASLSAAPDGVLAAWETGSQVKFGKVDPVTGRIGTIVSSLVTVPNASILWRWQTIAVKCCSFGRKGPDGQKGDRLRGSFTRLTFSLRASAVAWRMAFPSGVCRLPPHCLTATSLSFIDGGRMLCRRLGADTVIIADFITSSHSACGGSSRP